MKITIFNSFHETETTVIPATDGTISRQVKLRADRDLCGMTDCQCGKSKLAPADCWGERFVVVAQS